MKSRSRENPILLTGLSCVWTRRIEDLAIEISMLFNKALLGKWSWRFASECEYLLEHAISGKCETKKRGWCLRLVRNGYSVWVVEDYQKWLGSF